jgi:threonine/homoserine/homoserine lactone efflux protein
LTLGNPPTLITFAALFTAIAPRGAANAFTVFATVAGVAAGSLVWWVALTACLAAFRNFMTPAVRRAIAIVSGIALAAFGAVTVL